jgi:formylmethanofuran dehydrogenase subunit E
MESFDELLVKAEAAHGHMCPGQILGVRMAMLGLRRLGIEEPRGKDRKRLVTYVEIDRCATDAISVVTSCRLGKRTLKFRDWGKMAATFVDIESGKAIRIVASEGSRELAQQLHPDVEPVRKQQSLAYRELSDEQLFHEQWVKVEVAPSELPGFKGERVICSRCGESVNFGRIAEVGDERLCLGCAEPGPSYWEPAD